MEPARSDLVDQIGLYKREEGCGGGRIREEAAAICLHIQYTWCEKPVGRYKSHKLSCKSERDDDILTAGQRDNYTCQFRTTGMARSFLLFTPD